MSNTLEVIETVTTTLKETGGMLVAEYTHWMIWASASYIMLGIAFIVLAVYLFKKSKEWEEEGFTICLALTLGILGAWIVTCNIPDLFSPTAPAINTLLHYIT